MSPAEPSPQGTFPRKRKSRAVTGQPSPAEQASARSGFFATHDIGVAVTCLLLLALGYVLHARIARPLLSRFDHQGLSFDHPVSWLPTQSVGQTPDSVPAQIWYQAIDDPHTRLEIRIEPRPTFTGALGPVLDLARGQTYGALSKKVESDTVRLLNRPWQMTRFTYAYRLGAQGMPALSNAIELAAVHGDRLYVVTLHGADDALAQLEPILTERLSLR